MRSDIRFREFGNGATWVDFPMTQESAQDGTASMTDKPTQAQIEAIVEENKRWRKLIGNIVWVCNGTKNAETVDEILKIIRNAGVTLK